MNNSGAFNYTEIYDGSYHMANVSWSTNFPVSTQKSTVNKYVYFKQNFIRPYQENSQVASSKVLLNPQFNKKVFVNPNFQVNAAQSGSNTKIHVNPNIHKLHIPGTVNENLNVNKIHVNPHILGNTSVSLTNKPRLETPNNSDQYGIEKDIKTPVYSSETKLIHTPAKESKPTADVRKIRRLSIHSKFKIVKSTVLNKSISNDKRKIRTIVHSKYKLIAANPANYKYSNNYQNIKPRKIPSNLANKYKVDNRNIKQTLNAANKNKKFIYIDKFTPLKNIARNKMAIVNISGCLYKKSHNSLRRTSGSYKKIKRRNSILKIREKVIIKSKYKFVRSVGKKSPGKLNTDSRNMVKKSISRTSISKISPGKLRKCNIPCPYYRKFGRCKLHAAGKCFRKHDPDQIVLCTKFLQGACVEEKCLLSHNVSPEKMPTCKFYLEGTCSKDGCPYLHVRISPKADICKDFLEGFCKKAAKCDKRHQFLCPDFEKSGTCLKQRCMYPHGQLVRKYSVFNKHKFAKKSSNDIDSPSSSNHFNKVENKNCKLIDECVPKSDVSVDNVPSEVNVKARYYVDQIIMNKDEFNSKIIKRDQGIGPRTRPKLGDLPSFIAFEETL